MSWGPGLSCSRCPCSTGALHTRCRRVRAPHPLPSARITVARCAGGAHRVLLPTRKLGTVPECLGVSGGEAGGGKAPGARDSRTGPLAPPCAAAASPLHCFPTSCVLPLLTAGTPSGQNGTCACVQTLQLRWPAPPLPPACLPLPRCPGAPGAATTASLPRPPTSPRPRLPSMLGLRQDQPPCCTPVSCRWPDCNRGHAARQAPAGHATGQPGASVLPAGMHWSVGSIGNNTDGAAASRAGRGISCAANAPCRRALPLPAAAAQLGPCCLHLPTCPLCRPWRCV